MPVYEFGTSAFNWDTLPFVRGPNYLFLWRARRDSNSRPVDPSHALENARQPINTEISLLRTSQSILNF